MPKYLGPYDVVVIDGKEYQRGDNVTISAERRASLRSYLFEGDEQPNAEPIMHATLAEAHPPNEFGVPEPLKSQTASVKVRAADDNATVPQTAAQA